MVKIIDGEILQGPKLVRQQQQPRKVVHEPQGQGAGGLPSLLVFGAPVTPTQLMLLAGAGLFMGFRGLLLGVIIWFLYSSSQRMQQGAAAAGGQQPQGGAANMFSTFMAQAPLGSRGGLERPAAAGSRPGSAVPTTSNAGAAGSGGGAGWEGRGKAYKLSG
ncbi:hypothetical protein N2152v2_008915 [Parachlorella kessleri]